MNKELAPRELRIGNKLQKSNGEVFTIKRLDKTEDVLVEEENSLLTLNYNLHGIPLTEEILLKCGFIFDRFQFNYETDNFIFSIMFYDAWNIHYKEKSIFNADEVNISGYWNLHQLQNLFYSLCGIDLEIKI